MQFRRNFIVMMQSLLIKSRLIPVPCIKNLNAGCHTILTIPTKKTTGRKRFRLEPVSQDPEYLCSHVAGLNYRSDMEPVKMKPDSEYPDWIWEMRLDRHPGHEIYDENTKEFWENVAYENMIRVKRMIKNRELPSMTLLPHHKEQMKLKERFKERLVATHQFDSGYNPEELRPKLNEQLAYRPQVKDEVVYADEIDLPTNYRSFPINRKYIESKNMPKFEYKIATDT